MPSALPAEPPDAAAPTAVRHLRIVPPPQIDPRDREVWEAVQLIEEATDRMRSRVDASWWLDVQAGVIDPSATA